MVTALPLTDFLRAGPFQAYTYAYPHKTAYRPMMPPVPLRDAWAQEKRDNLFLYLHIPFCEMRCGFCNLFTTVNAPQSLEQAYLDAVERQARVVREELGEAKFSRLALGGGTPTYLEAHDLARLFDLFTDVFDAAPAHLPTSVETSPATATPDRLAVLANRGISRVSIGIQSFIESEVHSVGRAQKNTQVMQALENIRAAQLPNLNIDLIYGLAHQTPETWLHSLKTALEWQPEELFLYPLYVRPLTGIGRLGRTWDDERLELYRLGRDLLLANGYVQTSMRRFEKSRVVEESSGQGHHSGFGAEPEYTCQLDGMVGLGCGARSYTRHLHYSSEYAVGAVGVREIIQDFVARPAEAFAVASHGFQLNADERKRRFILQSLLHYAGLNLTHYNAEFAANALADYPQLRQLIESGFAVQDGQTLTLTPAGMEQSDAIGPWFYSPAVNELSQEYEWK